MRLLKVWKRIVPGAGHRQLESIDGRVSGRLTVVPFLQLLPFLLHNATAAGQW